MIAYLSYTILCQTIFLLAYWSFLKEKSQFHWNRFFLLGSLALSFILPCFRGIGSTEDIYAPTMLLPDVSVAISSLTVSQMSEEALVWSQWLWIIVSMALSILMIWRIYQLYVLIKDAPKVKYPKYTLVYVPDYVPACSFGMYVLWPQNQPIEQHEAVLWHEVAHIEERHTLDILFINLLHIIFWMNPLIWLYGRELKSQHEFLADRKVITAIAALETVHSDSPKAYIKLLVTSVLKQANLGYVHTFHESNIKTRIKMIKSWNETAISWKQLASAFTLFGLMGLGVACTETSINKKDTETVEYTEIEEVVMANPSDPATIQGGFKVLSEGLQENLKYPKEAKADGVEGKVMVSFVVDTDGNMGEYTIAKSLGHGCDQAAIEALKASNIKWNPAKMDGKRVKQKLILPINFALD